MKKFFSLRNKSKNTALSKDDKALIKEGAILCVKIIDYDKKLKMFKCHILDDIYGYIPLQDYTIYKQRYNALEIGKTIYANIVNYDTTLNMYKLERKSLILKTLDTLHNDLIIEAKVLNAFSDSVAFCELGYGAKASIKISDLIPLPEAVYSIADLLLPDTKLTVKIQEEYTPNHFSITTKEVLNNYFDDLEVGAIVEGKVGTKIHSINPKEYSYFFIISMRTIGIINSNIPLGYLSTIKAEVHKFNEHGPKFKPIY